MLSYFYHFACMIYSIGDRTLICNEAWMCHSFNKVFKIIAPGGNDWGYAEWLTRGYGLLLLLLLLLLRPCRSQQFHFTFSLHFRRTGVNLQSWPFIISAWLAQSETSAGRTQAHLLPQLPEGDFFFFFSLSLSLHSLYWLMVYCYRCMNTRSANPFT